MREKVVGPLLQIANSDGLNAYVDKWQDGSRIGAHEPRPVGSTHEVIGI